MESPMSPRVRKIAGEIMSTAKRNRSFSAPTEICLEDWWLSKPAGGQGIAVSGRPLETRMCDYAQGKFHSAPAKRRYASREFHSAQIVKRHGCTTIETSDGFIVSLCGFINKSRAQQNGFSSEVCRDFIYGFPFNWDDYAAQNVGEESNQITLDSIEGFLPGALNIYSGAQLHDLAFSLTDAERDLFNKRTYDNLMGLLSSQEEAGIGAQPSTPSPSLLATDDLMSESSKKKDSKKLQRKLYQTRSRTK